MADLYQSINKGVFVIPFEPSDAGPSRPARPLKRVYDKAFEIYQAAHQAYESDRTSEGLDDIADWLDRSSAPPILKTLVPIHRIPIAVIQNISPTLPELLPTLLRHTYTIHARDAQDLPTAVRGIAVGFVGEELLMGRKSGRTGIDEVERWWSGLRDKPPLMLHIEQAQMIPNHVLAELTYILTLHPKVPFRLLFSVPFITTFLASWTHIEPSAIDLSILHAGRSRKGGAAVSAILKAGTDPTKVPITIGNDLEEELKGWEEMTGGGAGAALKALKWNLLRHSLNSPLNALDAESHGHLNDLVSARMSGVDTGDMPGNELLELDNPQDLGNVIDPAPRLAILQALSDPNLYTPLAASSGHEALQSSPSAPQKSKQTATPRSVSARSRKRIPDTPPAETEEADPVDIEEGGDLKELETLFSLWKSAGRSVNLWDWLEGFRSTITHHADGQEETGEEEEAADDVESGGKRKRTAATEGHAEELDEATQTRLHATFVRFCEEARMLGLVRARGKGTGKRGDEVVKGVGLI